MSSVKGKKKNKKGATVEPEILNRKARHQYHIDERLEVGMRLTGTEVKSVRGGKVSLGEGYVVAKFPPARLTLHGVHISEYENASAAFQHKPTRVRELLAHKREIEKLHSKSQVRGMTIVPLRVYFKNGVAKLEVGLARGKAQHDKREDIKEREAKRDMDRAMSRRM